MNDAKAIIFLTPIITSPETMLINSNEISEIKTHSKIASVLQAFFFPIISVLLINAPKTNRNINKSTTKNQISNTNLKGDRMDINSSGAPPDKLNV